MEGSKMAGLPDFSPGGPVDCRPDNLGVPHVHGELAAPFIHGERVCAFLTRIDPWIFLSRPLATISGKPSDYPNKFRKVRSR